MWSYRDVFDLTGPFHKTPWFESVYMDYDRFHDCHALWLLDLDWLVKVFFFTSHERRTSSFHFFFFFGHTWRLKIVLIFMKKKNELQSIPKLIQSASYELDVNGFLSQTKYILFLSFRITEEQLLSNQKQGVFDQERKEFLFMINFCSNVEEKLLWIQKKVVFMTKQENKSCWWLIHGQVPWSEHHIFLKRYHAFYFPVYFIFIILFGFYLVILEKTKNSGPSITRFLEPLGPLQKPCTKQPRTRTSRGWCWHPILHPPVIYPVPPYSSQ